MTSLKRYFRGTHRAVSPQATLDAVTPLLPEMGVTRVANVTGLDTIGIPVVMVTRPLSWSLSVAQGKGLDLSCAMASGVMEAVETYWAERVTVPLVYDSHDNLQRRASVLNLATLGQLAAGARQFRSDARVRWVEGVDLVSGRSVLLPYELVHTDYRYPLMEDTGYFKATTNGLASGNTRDEALAHALCEVIERDATARWLDTTPDERRLTQVDPASIDDRDCQWLLERYESARVSVKLWRLPSRIDIPCFYCRVVDCRELIVRPLGPSCGIGCHLSPGVALVRALTEAAQSRLTMIAGSRDDLALSEYHRFPVTHRETRAREETSEARESVAFTDVQSKAQTSLEGDVELLVSELRQTGVEHVLSVVLSPPEMPFSVVRVIVPAMKPPRST